MGECFADLEQFQPHRRAGAAAKVTARTFCGGHRGPTPARTWSQCERSSPRSAAVRRTRRPPPSRAPAPTPGYRGCLSPAAVGLCRSRRAAAPRPARHILREGPLAVPRAARAARPRAATGRPPSSSPCCVLAPRPGFRFRGLPPGRGQRGRGKFGTPSVPDTSCGVWVARSWVSGRRSVFTRWR